MLHVADQIVLRTIDMTETKSKILAVGEQLIGERGFAVAMHEIAQQAGQANKYAIQYHFGDRDGLVSAIFTARERFIFDRRTELIAMARKKKVFRSLPALLEIIYLPIAEQVDANGRHSFARFWLQYNARPEAHGLTDNPFSEEKEQFYDLVERIAAVLKADFDKVTRDLQFLGWLNFAALIDRDSAGSETLETVFVRAIRLISGAVRTAPRKTDTAS